MTDDPHDSGSGFMWSMEPWLRTLFYDMDRYARSMSSSLERQAAALIAFGKFNDPIPVVLPKGEMFGKTGRIVIDDINAFDYPDRHPARIHDTDHAMMRHYMLASGVDHADKPDMTAAVIRNQTRPVQMNPKRYRKGDK